MYKFINDPVTGKNIIYNYINQLQTGGGPFVKISEKMLNSLSYPCNEAHETGMDCGAISLYFLGIFDKTLEKVISYIIKNSGVGITTDYLLQLIREYENKIRTNNPELIINDLGPSRIMFQTLPISKRSIEEDKLKWYERMINNIFTHIPNGFGTILFYQRFDYSGHFLIIIKGINGSMNLLDIQQKLQIKGINAISQYCLQQKILKFGIFYNGLFLNSVENPTPEISGHTKITIPIEEVKELVRNISYGPPAVKRGDFTITMNPDAAALVMPSGVTSSPQSKVAVKRGDFTITMNPDAGGGSSD